MSTIPNYMPVLSSGKHSNPSEGACIMEYASVIAGEKWSDRPSCTHPVLTRVAQQVNDSLSDDDRHVLLPLLPRLMGTGAGTDDPALSVRLAVWAARRVAHLNPDPRVMAAIKAAEACVQTPSPTATKAARAAVLAAEDAATEAVDARAADTAYAARYAASCAARGASASSAPTAAGYAAYAHAGAAADAAAEAAADAAADERVEFLADLITEYDRLTGRTEHPTVTEDDLRRCAELTA